MLRGYRPDIVAAKVVDARIAGRETASFFGIECLEAETQREKGRRAFVNREEFCSYLAKTRPKRILALDMVCGGATKNNTANLIIEVIREALPSTDVFFFSAFSAKPPNGLQNVVRANHKASILESSLGWDTEGNSRLNLWNLLAGTDLGDRLRQEPVETPMDYERQALQKALQACSLPPQSRSDYDPAEEQANMVSLKSAVVCLPLLPESDYSVRFHKPEESWVKESDVIRRISQLSGLSDTRPIAMSLGIDPPKEHIIRNIIKEIQSYGFIESNEGRLRLELQRARGRVKHIAVPAMRRIWNLTK